MLGRRLAGVRVVGPACRPRPPAGCAPVDADALAHVDEVRGGEEAGAVARLAQHPLHHGAGGALALGARHVDHAQPAQLLIQAQPLQGGREGWGGGGP